MKKLSYIFLCQLTAFMLISEGAFAGGAVITKVALKYQGESSYRIYNVSNVNMPFNPNSNTAEYGPNAIVTLTDESNSLPSGIITAIKIYFDGNGWLPDPTSGAPLATPDNAFNFLGSSNIDLTTVTRKRVTIRFYGGQGGGEDLAAVSPAEQNL